MFEIDLRTLYLSFVTSLIVSLGMMTLLWSQTRKRFEGMHLLLFFVFTLLLGITLITLRGTISDFLSIIVGNFFVVGGPMLGYFGLEKFVGVKTSRWRHYLLFSVFICVQVFYTYVQNSLDIRNLNVGIALLLISLDSALLLLYKAGKSMRKITFALGLVYSFLVIVGIIRIIRFIVVDPVEYDFFHQGSFESYVSLLYQISFFLLIFFLTLVINKRLLSEIGEQEEKFSKAFRHSPYGIIISRMNDGYVMEVNEGFEDILGYKAVDVIGKTSIETNLWLEESDRELIITQLRANKRVKNLELNFRKANAELILCEFTCEAIMISEELCLISVINDISEQKKNENDLIKSQSMLRRFASNLQIVGEEEKVLLATQIDNELNQTLVALKMDIGILKQRLKDSEDKSITEELFQKLDDVNKVVGNSLGFSLKLMSNLRNEVLYMMGFVEAMRLFVDDFSISQPNIKCHLDIGELIVQPSQKQSTTLYRMFESTMSNVASHSKASEVIISLHSVGNKLELEIADNGVGFEYNGLKEHTAYGLMLMRERTTLLNGEMFVNTAPGEGTSIKIVVPVGWV